MTHAALVAPRLTALAARSADQRLAVLSEQQAAITRALAAMNDGRWSAAESGADSVEGWLVALNPTWAGQLQPRVPTYGGHEPPPPPPAETSITWIGSPNHYSSRAGMATVAIVIHTMAGTIGSCDAWFQNPASQVSSHYGVGLSGQIHQYVALSVGSWANGVLEPGNRWRSIVGNSLNPNYQTVTIETEDLGSSATPVSEEQYAATLAGCRIALRNYPSIRYLMDHSIISPRSRPNCAGNRWRASGKFQQLANALGLEAF